MEQLVPVVAFPALVAAIWAAVGLRLQHVRLWVAGGAAAAGLAGTLMLVAAFLPFIGSFGTLAVPALCVGAGILLMRVFTSFNSMAAASPVPLAFLVVLQPPVFPVVLPLILVLPLWVVGWLERSSGAGRYALAILAILIAVPAIVYGTFFMLRGQG